MTLALPPAVLLILVAHAAPQRIALKRWILITEVPSPHPMPTRHSRSLRHPFPVELSSYIEAISQLAMRDRFSSIGKPSSPQPFAFMDTVALVSDAFREAGIRYQFIKLGRGSDSGHGSDVDVMLADYGYTKAAISAMKPFGYKAFRLSVDRDPLKLTLYKSRPENGIAVDLYQELEIGRLYLFTKAAVPRRKLFKSSRPVGWHQLRIPMPSPECDIYINGVHDFGHRRVTNSSLYRTLDIIASCKVDWNYLVQLCRESRLEGPMLFYLGLVDAFSLWKFGRRAVAEEAIKLLMEVLDARIGARLLPSAKPNRHGAFEFPMILIVLDFLCNVFPI